MQNINTAKHVVCPHCGVVNRIQDSRLIDNPQCGKCAQPIFIGQPVELTADNFIKHLSRNDIPLLVDFWAPWCGPCKMMAPAFVQAAKQLEPHVRLAKVNTESHQDLGGQFAIRSIPTMIFFVSGVERARQSGAMDSAAIIDWVRSRLV